ncbi:hypothetical protein [Methylorubrum extorquens]|uniref:Uncharacterized protein n=1 Tax=Methylorubrum extorquens (strain CM4 / NCIMB 13688) TaxID=440085 RepID=B7KSV2_METC4|nr:hypothetical protein [Methylorubrum extorquens]ACK82454.1 hypothetical protein Mchl_1590 [Methylorubrum extorquens CM4]
MKTVEILRTFDGYPTGKDERRFTAGEQPELSNEYAALLIAKGLAREPRPPAKATAPAKPKDDAA